MKPILSVSLILSILLAGCAGAPPAEAGDPTASPVALAESTATPFLPVEEATATPVILAPELPPVGLTPQLLRNSNYSLDFDRRPLNFTLVEGAYQTGPEIASADYYSAYLFDILAFGDLTGDGQEEAAVLVGVNFGGTGTFISLVLVGMQNGQPVQLAQVFIGEQGIDAISIAGNEIRLSGLTYGPNDPHCCPSVPYTQNYLFYEGQLLLAGMTTFTPVGSERVITIDSPANFSAASGSVRVTGGVSIAPFENNLSYHIYDGLTASELAAGPLMVTAPDFGAPGTFDAEIPLTVSPSGGLLRIEIKDLSAADGSLLSLDTLFLTVP